MSTAACAVQVKYPPVGTAGKPSETKLFHKESGHSRASPGWDMAPPQQGPDSVSLGDAGFRVLLVPSNILGI